MLSKFSNVRKRDHWVLNVTLCDTLDNLCNTFEFDEGISCGFEEISCDIESHRGSYQG